MSEASTPPQGGRSAAALKLNSIQYLRAIAAAIVVLSHAANSLLGHTSHLINLDYGAYGVDIFFVVSGFVMYYTTAGTGIRPGKFFIRRLIRIFPLYFILSTLMFALVVLSPANFNKESPDFWAYCKSILFIPHWNPRFHDMQPIIGPGWTLNYEMFFYLLFAISLTLRNKISGILVILMISALVGFGHLHSMDNAAFITYTSPLMMEFCLGIVVASSFINTSNAWPLWPAALIVLLGAAIVYLFAFQPASYTDDALRPLFVGLPCAFTVASLVAIERCGWLPNIALLALVGDASYSLYLVHTFVLGFGRHFWPHFIATNSILSHTAFVTAILVTSVAAALVTYRYLELPVSRFLNDSLRHRQARP